MLKEVSPLITEYPPHIKGTIVLATETYKRNYQVVFAGGSAFDLLTCNEEELHNVNPFKEDGRQLRDIDVICDRSVPWGDFIRKTKPLLPQGINVSADLSGIYELRQDYAALRHHHSIFKVPPEMFQPVIIVVNNTPIPVVPPQTLYHMLMYSYQRTGRKKDAARAEQLLPRFKDFPLPFDEGEYEAFGELFELVDSWEYPLTTLMYRLDRNRHRLPTLLSPVKMAHKIPGGEASLHFVRRQLFELERR